MARLVFDPSPSSKQGSKRASFMSGPLVVILICAIAGIPAVSGWLINLDSTLHTNNDVIVYWILLAIPFIMVALAITGLLMMLSKPSSVRKRRYDVHHSGHQIR